MPRKGPKTSDDLPTYGKPILPPLALADDLEGFLEGLALRRIIHKYGVDNLQFVLSVIAEQARQELIDRRRRETQDAWKSNTKPVLAYATAPSLPALRPLDERRGSRHYRRHREEHVDSTILEQARVRQLETGLAFILESEPEGWPRNELVAIVDGVRAGLSVSEIAQDLGCSVSTVELRLAKLRNAAVSGEIEQLAGK
jgi:DNA-directed RNA polymerase specialized sigma24 family protein